MWSRILAFVLLDVADDLSNDLLVAIRQDRARKLAKEMRSV